MMKVILSAVLAGALLGGADTDTLAKLKEGDILFQSSGGRQGTAIKLATHSKFSHVGIVLKKDGRLQVLEAVQPVKYTPWPTG